VNTLTLWLGARPLNPLKAEA